MLGFGTEAQAGVEIVTCTSSGAAFGVLSQLSAYCRAKLEYNLQPPILSSESRLCLFSSLPSPAPSHLSCASHSGGQPRLEGLQNHGITE